MYDYLIIGAGFAGAVMAERIANQMNKKVLLVEKRAHIGGNAFDEYDEHGILIHKYGPHCFHTNSKIVFEYLSKFTEWRFYEHKVLANLENTLYPIPINRITLNKLYGLNLKDEHEVRDYYASVREKRFPVLNSEDIIVNQVGTDLFEKFFKHYTKKQWGYEPKELSPIVCGRIPVRTNDDCRYFTDKYQFMPVDGYTRMFERMLNHKKIEIILDTDYKSIINDIRFNKIIYTGPIDYFFDYQFGKLPYRSIKFEFRNFKSLYYQTAPVVNFVSKDDKFTRVTEYKRMTGKSADTTTVSFEYTTSDGEQFYPIPNEKNRKKYLLYKAETNKMKNIFFIGRLAEYQYYNMDQTIANALTGFSKIIH